MYFNYTTIGFFDSMGNDTVDYILKQTELSTIFCADEYVAKLITMRKGGLATNITKIVTFDAVEPKQKEDLAALGIELMSYASVSQAGAGLSAPFNKCT